MTSLNTKKTTKEEKNRFEDRYGKKRSSINFILEDYKKMQSHTDLPPFWGPANTVWKHLHENGKCFWNTISLLWQTELCLSWEWMRKYQWQCLFIGCVFHKWSIGKFENGVFSNEGTIEWTRILVLLNGHTFAVNIRSVELTRTCTCNTHA